MIICVPDWDYREQYVRKRVRRKEEKDESNQI